MKSKRFKHLNTKYKGTGLTKEEKKEWSELELERMDRDEFKSGFVLLDEKPETKEEYEYNIERQSMV